MNKSPASLNSIIDNIDNVKSLKTRISNISNNNKSKDNPSSFALREDYRPASKEAYIAVDIAKGLNDTKAFARHLKIVQLIGQVEAYRVYRETLDTIRIAKQYNKPIKNPGALYNSKVAKLLKKNIYL